MPTCFVMQPFDGSTFDKRYEDVFEPGIRDAGLEPYRVDRDPGVSIPIQDIERGIRDSSICLAEITLDNPNVWYELGFASACGKDVILICSNERTTKFPFDVQHRTIIKYTNASIRDFNKLKVDITAHIRASLEKSEALAKISELSVLAKQDGLEQLEVVTLAILAQNLDSPEGSTSHYQVQRDMEASGFTKIATTIALRSLIKKNFISYDTYSDEDGETYLVYILRDAGWDWVLANKNQFVLKKPDEPTDDYSEPSDIPF